jgi:hypothetical protein
MSRYHTHVKTTLQAERCGLVRWLPMSMVGMPHCLRGWFGFLLKRRPRLLDQPWP